MTVEVTSKAPSGQLSAPPTLAGDKEKGTMKPGEVNLKSVKSNDTIKPPQPSKPPKKKRSRAANVANNSIFPLLSPFLGSFTFLLSFFLLPDGY